MTLVRIIPILLLAAGLQSAPLHAADPAPALRELPVAKIYKTPTCGCCGKWVKHMETAGFRTEVTDLDNVDPIKAKNGITPALASCHTALVGGYVVEGHVPPEDVKRLLSERPDIIGISAPGMPAGSPGMEGPVSQPYDVLAVHRDGTTSVFASHGK